MAGFHAQELDLGLLRTPCGVVPRTRRLWQRTPIGPDLHYPNGDSGARPPGRHRRRWSASRPAPRSAATTRASRAASSGRAAMRQVRGQRRRVGAAGAVSGTVGVALALDLAEVLTVVVEVAAACARCPPVTTTTAGPRLADAPGQLPCVVLVGAFGQHTRLGQVGGDHRGQRQDQLAQRVPRLAPAAAPSRSRTPSPGSTTTGTSPISRRALRAQPRSSSTSPSIPTFTASTPMSSTTARTWSSTASGDSGYTAVTPSVFWAVIAVIAVIPCVPQRAKAFRSAWMPAPPPGIGARDGQQSWRCGGVQEERCRGGRPRKDRRATPPHERGLT